MSCNCGKKGLDKEKCSMYIDYPEDDNCCLVSIEKNGEMSCEQIAKRLGVTRAWVYILEQKALEKIGNKFKKLENE